MLFLKIIFSGIVSISTANVIQTPCPNKKILGTTLVHLKNNGKVKVIRWSTGRKYFCCILPITIHYYPEKSNKDALPPQKITMTHYRPQKHRAGSLAESKQVWTLSEVICF